MYLTTLNCTFKMVKMISFMCVLPNFLTGGGVGARNRTGQEARCKPVCVIGICLDVHFQSSRKKHKKLRLKLTWEGVGTEQMEGTGRCDTCHVPFESSKSISTGLRNSQLLTEKQKCPHSEVTY